jgi:hypothetical protein
MYVEMAFQLNLYQQEKEIVGASNAAAVTSSVPKVSELLWGEKPPLANKKDQNTFSDSYPYLERGILPNTKNKEGGGVPPAHSQFRLLTPLLISQTMKEVWYQELQACHRLTTVDCVKYVVNMKYAICNM